jgi:AcrR family transcriptional regulator
VTLVSRSLLPVSDTRAPEKGAIADEPVPADTADTSRRGARRAAQTKLGREHVLDAAEEVFSRKGFHEATIKEIAAVAEFSVGAVYGFFENKDDLFVQVMERRGAALVPAMHDLVAGDGSPVEQLRALADLQIDFFRDHPAFARLFVRATGAPLLNIKASISDATRARYEEAMDLQAELFARGQAAGQFVDGPPAVLAEVFSGIVLAFQSHDAVVLEDSSAWALEDFHALLARAFVRPER